MGVDEIKGEDMTAELWSVILGLLMTLITQFIVKRGWATAVKALTAIVISVALAIVQGLVLKQFTLQTIVQNLTIIFAAGEALYGLYFKHLFEVRAGEQ
jgi:ABC-type polysaccharide/polyol phosphate export permease